ncbi:MAG TPA: sugar kinase, partial [Verrucomicrobiae bacterium]
EILDRVGGGDSFASGLQFGFLEFNDAQKAVEYGAAHGALASTTPGDTSMATRKEVEKTFGGGGARVQR